MRRIIDICWRLCKQVPLLPITILAAIPLALLGEWRPWGEAAWVSHDLHAGFGWLSSFNPGVGQWIVIALVVYTIVVTVRGMIDDLRNGPCWRRSAGGRCDCVDGCSAGILGRLGRGADDLIRRGNRGIRAVEGRKQPDRADRRGTPNRARGCAAGSARACACYGQRAYGRRDSRRIPRRQNVRFCRNGQPRRRKAYLRVRISRIGHQKVLRKRMMRLESASKRSPSIRCGLAT